MDLRKGPHPADVMQAQREYMDRVNEADRALLARVGRENKTDLRASVEKFVDAKHKKDLTSDDYHLVARLIVERLTSILRLARERSMTPPFELDVTGADDDVVVRASITNDGHFEDISGFPEQPLTARFPLTATLSDVTGKTLELTIDPASDKVQ